MSVQISSYGSVRAPRTPHSKAIKKVATIENSQKSGNSSKKHGFSQLRKKILSMSAAFGNLSFIIFVFRPGPHMTMLDQEIPSGFSLFGVSLF